jgi:hypothetical protein
MKNHFKIRRKAPKSIGGRKATNAGQSPSVASLCFAKASLAFGEASSGCAGQKSR